MDKIEYVEGSTEHEPGDIFPCYGITAITNGNLIHEDQILVFGDKHLRDKIISLLNSQVRAIIPQMGDKMVVDNEG